MTLFEALALKDREVVSLAGGGGKTTLMFALGRELGSRRSGVILTTTTRILEPSPSPDLALFVSDQISQLKKWITASLPVHPCLLIAARRLDEGKLGGVPPDWIEEIHSLPGASTVIIEADGAAGRPLKAPREGEPVLAPNTTLLIPVAGIDVLGRPLEEEHVFRSDIAARLLKIPKGSEVTPEIAARLISELVKGRPAKSRVIPFINKVDLPGGLEKGRSLANFLFSLGGIEIERVILGQVRNSAAVKEVVFSR